jgi:hypothetical protein
MFKIKLYYFNIINVLNDFCKNILNTDNQLVNTINALPEKLKITQLRHPAWNFVDFLSL